jgi:NADH:ubiquinone oxidoreductase subunit
METQVQLLRMIFTWWHSQTIGTWWHTFTRGQLIGSDMQGNTYYQDKSGRSINGKPRRWVIYNGDVEASRVPPEWHGWLHYTVDEPPMAADSKHHAWQQEHQINLTGTSKAHQPRGTADAARYPSGYDAWRPE